ncbi:FAD-dependent monooxygenase [Alkalihalobacillus oceani]|uniref:FAD-dependent oxidoreductase n=1 Tax=Halalkalibacter oceani TaxID=1653776 RepID=UPI00203A3B8C|nr:NAD(P)/FAD-dependent oxidoreductase [Halalkalibacter oceani]MCM3760756.1 FAD-dependent monooxygenase [Halalkalibacter oceani]
MKTEVLIIGGGVAGLSLALKLARRSVPVIVVEREEGAGHLYKGELLQPKTLQIFERLGFLDRLEADMYPLEAVHTREVGRRREELLHVRMDYSVLPEHAMAAMIPHDRLRELLVKEALACESFQLVRPAVFLDLETSHTARIKYRDELQSISANIIVGADGRGSRIRKKAGITFDIQSYNHDFLTFSFACPPELKEGEMIADEERFLGLFPLPGERVRSVLQIRPGEYKQLKQAGPSAVHEHYLRLEPRLDGYVQTVTEWKEIQLMVPVRETVHRYYRSNLIVIGDAAHSVHPMAGEGMNLAIQDADILGELISWMYQSGKSRDYTWFHWFEDVRKKRVEYISWLSHLFAKMYSPKGRAWQRLRMTAIRSLVNSRSLHDKQMLNISGLGLVPFRAKDGFHLFFRGKRKVLQQHVFTTKDDYPWQVTCGVNSDDN